MTITIPVWLLWLIGVPLGIVVVVLFIAGLFALWAMIGFARSMDRNF